ncbi:hypothetical protein NDU88_000023 [Pleurodeles waltl]|uniref:Uncharacterized protein n=1 Tax=Pleurodeles waltl TaxID=8319 RepID=A0AAV7R3N8_PLEWA|nr:hypothetical protein NDU88_000023 [Pleurodeles waltl]
MGFIPARSQFRPSQQASPWVVGGPRTPFSPTPWHQRLEKRTKDKRRAQPVHPGQDLNLTITGGFPHSSYSISYTENPKTSQFCVGHTRNPVTLDEGKVENRVQRYEWERVGRLGFYKQETQWLLHAFFWAIHGTASESSSRSA